MKYKLSRSEWERIGSEQGWMKEAVSGAPRSEMMMPKLVRLQRQMKDLDGMISSIANLSSTTGDAALNDVVNKAREALFQVEYAITPKSMETKELG